MPGNDLPNLLSAITVALTLAVILFAWQTVREARRSTAEQQKAVAKLEAIGEAQESAVRELAAIHAADRRHRQLEQLRAIGRVVIVIRTAAEKELAGQASAGRLAGVDRHPWRCMEQSQLASELVGIDPPLPNCRALVGENQAAQVKRAADRANDELEVVFRSLGVGA